MPNKTPVAPNRAERVLAYMMLAVVGLSLVAFVAIIAGTVIEVDFTAGIWPTVFVTPYFGLPFAVILLITLVILNARRRAREASASRPTRDR